MSKSDEVQFCPPSNHAVLAGPFNRTIMTPSYYTASQGDQRRFPIDPTRPFVVIHPSFEAVLGPNPSLRIIAKVNDGTQFAHEAGVYFEKTDEVFFTSNLYRDPSPRNQLSKIELGRARQAEHNALGSTWEDIQTTGDECVTGNGGTRYGDKLLMCSQGIGLNNEVPSALVVVNPEAPYEAVPILNNFHGRPFNSINDVVVLPAPSANPDEPQPTTDRHDLHHLEHTTIWFTDPTYGFAQDYKPAPVLPNQVYCFNPTTGDVRCVADGFDMPNGLCFNREGTKLYVTDTGAVNKRPGNDGLTAVSSSPGTIYVFDVVRPRHGTDLSAAGPTLHNRRLFAFVDSGVPDGIKTDRAGNVYSGCGDGVHVWNEHGTLIGKILVPLDRVPGDVKPKTLEDSDEFKARYSANFCFVQNRLFVLAEDRILEVTLAGDVRGSL